MKVGALLESMLGRSSPPGISRTLGGERMETRSLCPPSWATKRGDLASCPPADAPSPGLWRRYPDLEDAKAPLPLTPEREEGPHPWRPCRPEVGFGEDAPGLFWVGETRREEDPLSCGKHTARPFRSRFQVEALRIRDRWSFWAAEGASRHGILMII